MENLTKNQGQTIQFLSKLKKNCFKINNIILNGYDFY